MRGYSLHAWHSMHNKPRPHEIWMQQSLIILNVLPTYQHIKYNQALCPFRDKHQNVRRLRFPIALLKKKKVIEIVTCGTINRYHGTRIIKQVTIISNFIQI